MTNKTLSIITCLLDGDPAVLDTAQSIIPQMTDSVEWLIKNSTQSEPEQIIKLTQFQNVRFIARPDSTLYEGINHGLEEISGEHVMVLGAGDILLPNAITRILAAINEFPEVASYFFALNTIADSSNVFKPNPSKFPQQMGAPHPATILKSRYCREINGYDQTYRIASDYDFMSRYLKRFNTYAISEDIIVSFKGGGLSEKRGLEALLEEELIRLRVWPASPALTAAKLRLIAERISARIT